MHTRMIAKHHYFVMSWCRDVALHDFCFEDILSNVELKVLLWPLNLSMNTSCSYGLVPSCITRRNFFLYKWTNDNIDLLFANNCVIVSLCVHSFYVNILKQNSDHNTSRLLYTCLLHINKDLHTCIHIVYHNQPIDYT